MIISEPSSLAFETAIVMPRSLNDPVGLAPSNLTYSSAGRPIFLGRLFSLIRGVFPSPKVIIGVFSVTGR